ncbi:hypothetical protein FB567DRAFT_619056 [Paraphoma chrysanthemicola]|uniref:Uncharacterized protein n=1 Tax=Paraphoma chrysanthemicola TaxID=798071 RepID=A0A8K0W008_9PLEO|nr:hypothetical protein FB567DRAFT_619056 [Paraphoma chrysanthemicola]
MVSQLVGAARWLYSLDTRATFVRKVVVDLDKTCSTICPYHWCPNAPPVGDCHGYQHALRMLDLLRQLWRNPSLELGFVHSKGKAHADYHPCNVSILLETNLDPKLLGIVTQAVRDDQLGLAKYGRQMQEIWIQRDCKEGRVVFRLSDCGMGSPKRHFSISPDGKTLAWKHDDTRPLLMNLPPDVRAKIFDLVSCSEIFDDRYTRGTVTWDLDAKTVTGASPVLSALCREGRLHRTCWHENRHAFKIKIYQIEVGIEHLHKLSHFRNYYRPGIWATRPRTRHTKPLDEKDSQDSQVEIILDFEIHPGYMSEDIRINLRDLLDVASSVRDIALLTVSISDGRGGSRAHATRSLDGIAHEASAPLQYSARGAWADGHLRIVQPPAPWTRVEKPVRYYWGQIETKDPRWFQVRTGW